MLKINNQQRGGIYIDDLKRKLRSLKKAEDRIRFQGLAYGEKKYIWDSFFSTKEVNSFKVKYPLGQLVKLSKEELKEIIEDFYINVYFQMHKERGLTFESLYDPNLLALLGLPPIATIEDIKKKFRELAKRHHPDHGGDSQRMIEILRVYEELLDK